MTEATPTGGRALRDPVLTLAGKTPTCPRCGYDLAVSTQLWPEDRCPTADTCSECGLRFTWSEVLNRPFVPKWLVEHRASSTLVWARAVVIPLLPWRAMQELSLALPRRIGRLWALALLMLVVLPYLTVTLCLLAPTIAHPSSGYPLIEAALWPHRMITQEEMPTLPFSWSGYWLLTPIGFIVMAHCALMPFAYCILDTTLGKANIRKSHLLRLGLIQLITVAVLACLLVGARTVSAFGIHEQWWDDQGLLHGIVPSIIDPTAHPQAVGRPYQSIWYYLLWSLLYWHAATRWYLRVKWALVHAFVLWFLSGLALLTLILVLLTPWS